MLGELPERMIADYAPYLKEPEEFRREVEEDARESGEVVCIEDRRAVNDPSIVYERVYTFAVRDGLPPDERARRGEAPTSGRSV